MSELLDTFISESRENLESASQQLILLHTQGFNAEAIDDVFRDLHTIKGSSDLFDIKPLTRLAHAAEDLLDSIRSQETPYTEEIADILLEGLDQISTFFDELEIGNYNLAEWAVLSEELALRLRGQMLPITGDTRSDDQTSTEESPHQTTEAPVYEQCESRRPLLARLDLRGRLSALSQLCGALESITLVDYQPDPDCFFRGEDPINVALATPGLVAMSLARKNDADLQDVYCCHLDLLLCSTAPVNELRQHLAYYEGQYELCLVSKQAMFESVNDALGKACRDDAIELAKSIIGRDALQTKRLSEFFSASNNPESDNFTVYQWLAELSEEPARLNELAGLMVSEQAVTMPAATMPALSDTATRLLTQQRTLLENMLDSANSRAALPAIRLIVQRTLNTEDVTDSDQDSIQFWIQQIDSALNTGTVVKEQQPAATSEPPATENNTSATPATDTLATKDEIPEPGRATERQIPKTLKVDQEKIDYLMDLVGELTVAKNSLPYLAKQAEEEGGNRQLSKQIKSHFSIVNRLTEELQSAVLQIRMVPVSHVFQRYPRLVRDLARKLNKKINLVMQGEDTEFDKNLIESLSEPLIHLLRNSIDHGIETPRVRLDNGKEEVGNIELIATPQDDNVIIEIRDDGKGIDATQIKMLAFKKGIITESQVESMDDNEALQLIFAPGFSTSETVSDLSGRGVGMDAVRTMVNQAGGTIEMHSEVGIGTQFKLILPQTMSVNRVMMFEVNGQMFGVSMDAVVETVKVPPTEIQHIKNHQVLVIREKLVPLYCLRSHLGFDPDCETKEEQAVMVVNTREGEIGLKIDRFHEGIDVIQKPLEGVMAGYSHFSGTALLGDGRVLLIINIQELLSCQ